MKAKSNSLSKIIIICITVVVLLVGCTCLCSMTYLLINGSLNIPFGRLLFVPKETNYTFEINSTQGWQESDVFVSQGDTVHISYKTGEWRVADWAEFVDANGYPRFEGYAPDVAHGALLAQISDGSIMPVLNELWFEADQDGILSFRINDADKFLYDNVGAIKVTIAVSSADR